MRLPQNLAGRNGPGEVTVRKIERGEGASVQPRTWARLETALAAPEGWVDRVLDGTATEVDLDVSPRPSDRASAPRGGGDRHEVLALQARLDAARTLVESLYALLREAS